MTSRSRREKRFPMLNVPVAVLSDGRASASGDELGRYIAGQVRCFSLGKRHKGWGLRLDLIATFGYSYCRELIYQKSSFIRLNDVPC